MDWMIIYSTDFIVTLSFSFLTSMLKCGDTIYNCVSKGGSKTWSLIHQPIHFNIEMF